MNIEELKMFLYRIGISKSSYNIDSNGIVIYIGRLAYIHIIQAKLYAWAIHRHVLEDIVYLY